MQKVQNELENEVFFKFYKILSLLLAGSNLRRNTLKFTVFKPRIWENSSSYVIDENALVQWDYKILWSSMFWEVLHQFLQNNIHNFKETTSLFLLTKGSDSPVIVCSCWNSIASTLNLTAV